MKDRLLLFNFCRLTSALQEAGRSVASSALFSPQLFQLREGQRGTRTACGVCTGDMHRRSSRRFALISFRVLIIPHHPVCLLLATENNLRIIRAPSEVAASGPQCVPAGGISFSVQEAA